MERLPHANPKPMAKIYRTQGQKPRRPRANRPAAERQQHRPTSTVARKPRPAGRSGLPTKQAILDYLKTVQGQNVGKREIVRAFSLKGPERVALKQLLAEMTEE